MWSIIERDAWHPSSHLNIIINTDEAKGLLKILRFLYKTFTIPGDNGIYPLAISVNTDLIILDDFTDKVNIVHIVLLVLCDDAREYKLKIDKSPLENPGSHPVLIDIKVLPFFISNDILGWDQIFNELYCNKLGICIISGLFNRSGAFRIRASLDLTFHVVD